MKAAIRHVVVYRDRGRMSLQMKTFFRLRELFSPVVSAFSPDGGTFTVENLKDFRS
jgi:hypothetical protein